MLPSTLKVSGRSKRNKDSGSYTRCSARIIRNELRPLKEDLADMDDNLQDFSERKSNTLMGRVRYTILDKNKLQEFKGRFRRFSETFRSMLPFVEMKAHDILIRNDVIGQQKLDTIL